MVSSNLVGPRISNFLETPDAQELNELFHTYLLCLAGTCANILSMFFVEMATNLPVTLVCDRASSCLPRSPEKSGSSPQQSLPKLEAWKPCVIEWQKGKTLDRKPCLFLTWNWAVSCNISLHPLGRHWKWRIPLPNLASHAPTSPDRGSIMDPCGAYGPQLLPNWVPWPQETPIGKVTLLAGVLITPHQIMWLQSVYPKMIFGLNW